MPLIGQKTKTPPCLTLFYLFNFYYYYFYFPVNILLTPNYSLKAVLEFSNCIQKNLIELLNLTLQLISDQHSNWCLVLFSEYLLLSYNKWVLVFAPIHDHLLPDPNDLMFTLQTRAACNPGFETYLVYDDPLSRSARRYFVLLQKLHRNHRSSCVNRSSSNIESCSSVNTQKCTFIAV